MNETAKGYALIALDKYIELCQVDANTIRITGASEEDLSVWEDYFDMHYDYSGAVKKLTEGNDDFLKKAATFGQGLRILRQDPFETLISFIISQNKNIPAIKSAVERISEKYGEKRHWGNDPGLVYNSFPSAENLAGAGKKALRELGLGYRDEYVYEAALAVAEGKFDLGRLKDLNGDEIIEELMTLKGVGKKVASCVALFAFHSFGSVPVDVWIARVIETVYGGDFSWEPYEDYAGLVQQYMFYYIRNCGQL